jgi:putative ATP-dependent endonuclease of OLD family
MNDVGKTNLLYALRFVLDKDIRKNNLTDSDYYCKNISRPIEIVLTIDISDEKCVDNQKLRAQLKGALLSEHQHVYIKLLAEYDANEMIGIPILYWGGDLEKLYTVNQHGYMSDLDYVFNVLYIDSHVDLNILFKRNIKDLIVNDGSDDKDIFKEIDDKVSELNDKISSLSGIKKFEDKITPEYRCFKNESISISVKSELAVKGLHSNIIPYIKQDEDCNLYPTSGDGRKKLLVYSIYNLLMEEHLEKKITIFMIEEPENNLHKSMQLSLSTQLFNEERYRYCFVSTHSPYILNEMNNVNLVRIYNSSKVNSPSTLYKVPKEYKDNKRKLNKHLAEAIFADKVLLVEGPSEEVLFDKIMSTYNEQYEANGIYILPVNGIAFSSYFTILDDLEIFNVVKTDNDLRKCKDGYSVLGFSRVNNYLPEGSKKLPLKPIANNRIDDKVSLYKSNKALLDEIREEHKIYLSKSDLENDLDEVIHSELVKYLNTKIPVVYLQDKKLHNMIELVDKLSKEDCEKLYEHYNFACIKKVME